MNEPKELRLRNPFDGPAAGAGIAVVGDIHGRLDRLDRALKQVPAERTLVFVGDCVDRGPESRGVVQRLIGLQEERSCVILCGNHEDMMIDALFRAYDGAVRDWMSNGGDATCRSYGVSDTRRLEEELPWEHLSFFQSLREHWETEEYVFVHAGISAAGPEATERDTKLWMRIAPDEAFGYAWSPFGLLWENNSSTTPNTTTTYTPGWGQRVQQGGSFADSFYQVDWLGSTRYVTDSTGNDSLGIRTGRYRG